MDNFDRAFAATIGIEGGYVNDPKDPGGETKYGVSKRTHPTVDIANLTLENAKSIYLNEYWNPSGGPALPYPIDCLVFDAAVNQGVGQALHMLGHYKDPVQYLAFRALCYTEAKNFDRFGRGWFNRLFTLAKEYL